MSATFLGLGAATWGVLVALAGVLIPVLIAVYNRRPSKHTRDWSFAAI